MVTRNRQKTKSEIKEPCPLGHGSLFRGKILGENLLVLLREFVVRAKHVDDFVLVHLDHFLTCRTAVLARVELARFLSEDTTHGSGERETGVAVNVDFANGGLGCLAQLLFRNTYCVRQLPPLELMMSTYSCGTEEDP